MTTYRPLFPAGLALLAALTVAGAVAVWSHWRALDQRVAVAEHSVRAQALEIRSLEQQLAIERTLGSHLGTRPTAGWDHLQVLPLAPVKAEVDATEPHWVILWDSTAGHGLLTRVGGTRLPAGAGTLTVLLRRADGAEQRETLPLGAGSTEQHHPFTVPAAAAEVTGFEVVWHAAGAAATPWTWRGAVSP